VDGGRFPIKRVLGDLVVVEADAFLDGHDVVSVVLRYRPCGEAEWSDEPMEALGNDRWRAAFTVDRLGRWEYTVLAWPNAWATWRRDLRTRLEAGQDLGVELLIGADLVAGAAERAAGPGTAEDDRRALETRAAELRSDRPAGERAGLALDDALDARMERHPDLRHAATYAPRLEVVVDPVRARFSTWYELFPRSASPEPGRHGTLRDVVARLPYVAELGFDVLYLPPIHPIGRTFRKGPDNATVAGPEDPGVPWAIGSAAGGHTAVEPALGTLDDFDALVRAAAARGIEVSLDIAFQASPDHPAVRDHPGWFRHRPDGTVQYAENPPKKYQDIYPFDFESADWRSLWEYLDAVVRFWLDHGVRIFRVDNPHTKPFAFWEWLIADIKRDHPEALFLAEAFTRPKVMYRLAKLGFSQSYTYFTWRTTKQDLTDYFGELTRTNLREFFRPNVWPNTPDILHEVLQHGGRPAFEARLVLAATLAASYGIYGPPFELMEHEPREPGSEEYLHSEKYQLRHWDLGAPDSLAPLIGRVNRIRREHPALQSDEGLAFHRIDDDELLAYTKRTPDNADVILTVVSLDPGRARSGTVELPLRELGIDEDRPFEVEDLLDGRVEVWHGRTSRIEIDPAVRSAAIFHVRPAVRMETEFETYA
jgi:starch synthase (maltosyl-transferring)